MWVFYDLTIVAVMLLPDAAGEILTFGTSKLAVHVSFITTQLGWWYYLEL